MSVLKSLTLVAMPKIDRRDPKFQRRRKLIVQLEQQRELALDPNFVVARKKWKNDENGVKQLVDSPKRVKRWWGEDEKGGLILTVRYGSKPLALAPGKDAVAVGDSEQLVGVIDAVIAATKAGELDDVMAATQSVGQKPKVKAKA